MSVAWNPALDPDDHFFQLKNISKEAHLEKNRGVYLFSEGGSRGLVPVVRWNVMHKASLLFVLDHLLTPTSHTVQKADEMMSHTLPGAWQNFKACHLASYKVKTKVSGIC